MSDREWVGVDLPEVASTTAQKIYVMGTMRCS